jgi:hypothetical protein
MAMVPTNQKLWALIVTQAKAKYTNYPNPGASHWVHQQYIKNGGKFVETSEETRRKKLLARQFEQKKQAKMAHYKEHSDDKKKSSRDHKNDKNNEDKKK